MSKDHRLALTRMTNKMVIKLNKVAKMGKLAMMNFNSNRGAKNKITLITGLTLIVTAICLVGKSLSLILIRLLP